MASLQNSKEATRRPVTWEHGYIHASPKQMGKGGGQRGRFLSKLRGFPKYVSSASPFSPPPSRRWYTGLSSLPNLLTPSYTSISHQQWLKLPIWWPWWVETGWVLGRPASGAFQGLQCSISTSLLACYLGFRVRSEARGASQRVDAKSLILNPMAYLFAWLWMHRNVRREPTCPHIFIWEGYWPKLEPRPWHQHLGKEETVDSGGVWGDVDV